MNRALLSLPFSSLAMALALSACVDNPGNQVIDCGELATFPPVSNVLEKRCGTLDCHGNLARPFRLYGNGGLRLADRAELNDPTVAQANGTVSGGKSTTTGEFELNWRSICGLEPEKMTAVQSGDMEATELLVLRKPLGPEIEGGERHKGGQMFNLGGPGYVCVKSWIDGAVEQTDCTLATSDL